MAKNDNIKDFCTDIADAIRRKEGSSELINPQDFSQRIDNLLNTFVLHFHTYLIYDYSCGQRTNFFQNIQTVLS
jgi:hypothetical protein